MPGGSFEVTESETMKVTEKCDDGCSDSGCSVDTGCETSCYDASRIATWIVALILVLFFTVAMFSCFSGGWGDCDRDNDCGDKKRDCNDWSSLACGFLVWLIVIIIFLGAVWACGWAAIIFFIILILILGAAWWWGSCCKKDRRDHRD